MNVLSDLKLVSLCSRSIAAKRTDQLQNLWNLRKPVGSAPAEAGRHLENKT